MNYWEERYIHQIEETAKLKEELREAQERINYLTERLQHSEYERFYGSNKVTIS